MSDKIKHVKSSTGMVHGVQQSRSSGLRHTTTCGAADPNDWRTHPWVDWPTTTEPITCKNCLRKLGLEPPKQAATDKVAISIADPNKAIVFKPVVISITIADQDIWESIQMGTYEANELKELISKGLMK
jgi:hypothetical protein